MRHHLYIHQHPLAESVMAISSCTTTIASSEVESSHPPSAAAITTR